MRAKDFFREIYLGVAANKVRSGLTMLGIIIGIGSVIALQAVGQGAQNQIEASIQSIGSNLLLVTPGTTRGVGALVSAGRGSAKTLTNDDFKALQTIPSITAIAPELSSRYQVVAGALNTNTEVDGTQPSYMGVRNVAIAEGSFFTDEQVADDAKVAVIGPTTESDLFATGTDPIGQRIRVNGIDFTVVGVTVAKGGSGLTSQDDIVLVPLSSMQLFLTGGQYLTTIGIEANDPASMSSIEGNATTLLLKRHGITDAANADFSILNQADIVSAASSVTGTFTALLASIAGISLLVGGIGIMNMMLTTVTERTHEIGLRQAIGAQKGEIIGQFLGEAIFLTLLGGAIGILAGYGAAQAISRIAQISATVTWPSVGLAVGVSAAIGLVFGLYPAQRAAKLEPIEALRYE